MAERFLVAGGTGNWNSTTNWSATDGGASGASFPVAGDNVHLTAASGAASLTVNVSSACADIDMTGFTGTFGGSSALAVSGNWTWSAGAMTQNYTGIVTFNSTSGTKTITSNGKQFKGQVVFNGAGGTWQIADTFSSTATITPTNGTLQCNGQTITSLSMVCAAGTKQIQFANCHWIITGTGTVWSNQQLANYSQTLGGSEKVTFNGGAGLTTMDWSGTFTDFEVAGGTGGWTMVARNPTIRDLLLTNPGAGTVTMNSLTCRNVDCTGFAGTWAIGAATIGATGDITLSAGMSWTATTAPVSCANLNMGAFVNTWQGSGSYSVKGNVTLPTGAATLTYSGNFSMIPTAGTKTITCNGKTMACNFLVNTTGGATVQLADTFVTTGIVQLNNGTFDTNNQTWTMLRFQLAVGTKTLAMTNSHATCTQTGTAWDTSTNRTNLTVTTGGASKITFPGGVALTTMFVGATNNFDDIENTGGSGGFTISFSNTTARDIIISNPTTGVITFGNCSVRNVDFTGCGGSWNETLGLLITGNLTFANTMTMLNTTARIDFVGNGVTQLLTTAGLTLTFPFRVDGTNNTLRVVDTLTSTQFVQITVANCTLKLKAGVTNSVGSFLASGGSVGNTCKLQSDTPGVQTTISVQANDQISDFLEVTDIKCTGGARWWAGRHGVNGGNTNGWRFTDWAPRGPLGPVIKNAA